MKKPKIGNLTLENPFFLAPLAGITDAPFRKLCHNQGAALVYSEMVSAKGLWYKDSKSKDLLDTSIEEWPIAFQLFGSEPDIISDVITQIESLDNEIIDINMGCPVPKVVKNGEGSALMKTPELAAKIVEVVVSKSKKPVTVKTRIGWDEKSINIIEFARLMESAGAKAIAVHGRTREQYYSGKADWKAIADTKNAVSIPVIGSGDVLCAEDAVRMIDETGCDAVMIARGALGNPWIFREAIMLLEGAAPEEIAAFTPSVSDRVQMFISHARDTTSVKGEYIAVREMRKHAGWYFKGIRGSAEFRGKVNKIETLAELISSAERFAGIETD